MKEMETNGVESLVMCDLKVLAFQQPKYSHTQNDMCIYRVCVCLIVCYVLYVYKCLRTYSLQLCVCVCAYIVYGLLLHIHMKRMSE